MTFKHSSTTRMTTQREYELLNRLRRVESLSTAAGASKACFDSSGARMARMPGECVARLGGRLELPFLPPRSPELNSHELVWQAQKTNGAGRNPVESAKELHERMTVHMEALMGPSLKVRSFSNANHTIFAQFNAPGLPTFSI